MKTCPESRTGHRSPDGKQDRLLMGIDLSKTWEQIWFTGKFCCHADSKSDQNDLPGLEKEHSPAVRGQCRSISLCSGNTYYLKCFCAPRELAEQTAGSCRLQSEVSFIFSLSVVPGRRARPNTAYSAEKVQVLLKKMFLEAPSQLKHNSSLYICTDTQTPQLQPLNWWQVIP